VKIPEVSSLLQVFGSISIPEGLTVSASVNQGMGCVRIGLPPLPLLMERLNALFGGYRFSVTGSGTLPVPVPPPPPAITMRVHCPETRAAMRLLDRPENSAYKSYARVKDRSDLKKEWANDTILVGNRFGKFTCNRLRHIIHGAMSIAKTKGIALKMPRGYASREATMMIVIRDNREQFREIFELMPRDFAKDTLDDSNMEDLISEVKS
jgi:hypothetical protein